MEAKGRTAEEGKRTKRTSSLWRRCERNGGSHFAGLSHHLLFWKEFLLSTLLTYYRGISEYSLGRSSNFYVITEISSHVSSSRYVPKFQSSFFTIVSICSVRTITHMYVTNICLNIVSRSSCLE